MIDYDEATGKLIDKGKPVILKPSQPLRKARQTKSWVVEVSWKSKKWSKSSRPHTQEYHVAADDEDTAKIIGWDAYCQEHLTDVESEKFIECVELPRQYWV